MANAGADYQHIDGSTMSWTKRFDGIVILPTAAFEHASMSEFD
jgi:hypothetical protein